MEAFYMSCFQILQGEIWGGLTTEIVTIPKPQEKMKSTNSILSSFVVFPLPPAGNIC